MSPNPNPQDAEAVLDASSYYSSYPSEPGPNLRKYLMLKRAMDIVAASIGLILLSPVFLVLAIVIKAEDPSGPVFFSQQRVGKGERKFQMYKFRSMVCNAEELLPQLLDKNEIEGSMFKMREDPRITRIGPSSARPASTSCPSSGTSSAAICPWSVLVLPFLER